MRGDLSEQWRAYLDGEAEHAWGLLSSPATVARLKGVMDRLSGKRGQQGRSKM